MKLQYCWRCRCEVPMLDDAEWESIRELRTPKPNAGSTVGDAFQRLLDAYEATTGFREANPNAIWHHLISLYGDPCAVCGKPLRTPRATKCVECGAEVTAGEPG